MRIPNKRRALAGGLAASGLMGVLARAARRPGLLVLGYHRIVSPTGRTFDGVVSASPEGFERQVRDLRDHFRILGLDDVLDAADSGFALDEPSALISFDDGYRDNFEAALPVLRSLGVPAAFFLPTGFLDDPRPFWWDHLAAVLDRTRRDRIELDRPEPAAFDLAGAGRSAALRAIIAWFLDGTVAIGEEGAFLDHLGERAGVDLDAEALGRSLLMTWDEARALADAGMGIGSHGHSHRHLSRLPEAEQVGELSGSKRRLEDALGRPVSAIAYPYGVAGAYDEALLRRAREAGYRLGFTFEGGINRPGSTDPMAIRRINIGFSDSPAMVRARALSYGAVGRSWI